MDMKGLQTIAAPVDVVWASILDPEVLARCVPGCQELTGSIKDGYAATVVQRVGPVKATFRSEVTIEKMNAPSSLTLKGEGRGGVAGFARGEADVVLTEAEGGTQLDYVVRTMIGGKLAQLGSRIIDSFASKMANQFFDRFREEVESGRD